MSRASWCSETTRRADAVTLSCGASGIGQRSVRSASGRRRELRELDAAGREDVEDRFAAAQQVVRDDAPMAAPPHGLGAHDRAAFSPADLEQTDEPHSRGFA